MASTPIAKEYYVFIGTYAAADKKGLYVYKFNTHTGKAAMIDAVAGVANPSFLALSPDQQHLYVVSETHQKKDGRTYAYRFDYQREKLILLNHSFSKGSDPCNIICDRTGRWLFACNYSSGSLAVLPVQPKGGVGPLVQLVQHKGHSIDKKRQTEAHVHCAQLAPDQRHLLVTDLGMDQVFIYLLDSESGQLSPAVPPFTKVTPGSGPRIITFSADGHFVYLIHELGGQLSVFAYDNGQLTLLQQCSNLPKNYEGKIWAADLHLSPDGKFLYATNRDDLNDIVTYKVHANGKITPIDRQLTGGKTPRNFVISPDGKYLLCGHQNSGEITVFKRNVKNGLLMHVDPDIAVPHAACLQMVPVPASAANSQ